MRSFFETPGHGKAHSVTARPNSQFVMWPPRLAFGSAQYRQYELTEFGNLIKSNAIPLCMFEPNQSAFPFNSEQAKRNDQSFSLLHKFLTERKAVSSYPSRLSFMLR